LTTSTSPSSTQAPPSTVPSSPASASVTAPGPEETPGGQLVLPIPDILRTGETWRVPRERRVFVNRGLKLAEVDWIGFDMDYTLAIYDQPAMDELQIRATLPKLIKRGYPEYLHELKYDISFPIRGLFIDKKLGHIVKMDCYKIVQKAYHGLVEIPKEHLRTLYQQKKTRLTATRYHWIDTLYALSEVTLYASIVQALEDRGVVVDFTQLFNDIRECIDEAHRDGTITSSIEADFPKFIHRDPELAQALHRWRSAGKKLFVLTNSQRGYTEKMMHYLLDGALPEYPTWRHFFDMVVVAASKPAFFQERRPLLEWEGNATRPFSGHVERGRIYQGGNLIDFERVLGLVGDRVLYIGDHIYGDILRSKKESAWRTTMIIQEMNAEVLALDACHAELEALHRLDDRRREAEDELRFLQLRFKEVSRQVEAYASGSMGLVPLAVVEAERARIKRALEQARGALRTLDGEMIELEARIDKQFHTYWGSLLKEANETSSFGNQVEEYACLYTSKVSNFAAYSPLQHWRSPRDVMPHEM
jgi:5'-nucleotidase